METAWRTEASCSANNQKSKERKVRSDTVQFGKMCSALEQFAERKGWRLLHWDIPAWSTAEQLHITTHRDNCDCGPLHCWVSSTPSHNAPKLPHVPPSPSTFYSLPSPTVLQSLPRSIKSWWHLQLFPLDLVFVSIPSPSAMFLFLVNTFFQKCHNLIHSPCLLQG